MRKNAKLTKKPRKINLKNNEKLNELFAISPCLILQVLHSAADSNQPEKCSPTKTDGALVLYRPT
jgi:hypothetical protein